MEREELRRMLDLHEKWMRKESGGIRANLRDAGLRDADLRGANLRAQTFRAQTWISPHGPYGVVPWMPISMIA